MASGLSSPDPNTSASAFKYLPSIADIHHNPCPLTSASDQVRIATWNSSEEYKDRLSYRE